MLISRDEIIDLGFIRNLNPDLLLDYHITVAEEVWVAQAVGEDFWFDLNDDVESYREWILDYVAPVIALATLYQNFETLTQPMTEAGLAQFINETGVQASSLESRRDFKTEIYKNLGVMIKRMNRSGWKEQQSGNHSFTNYREPKDNPRGKIFGPQITIGAPI